jgi:hypothetical protein
MYFSGFSDVLTNNFRHHFYFYDYLAVRTGNSCGSLFSDTGVYSASFDINKQRDTRDFVYVTVTHTYISDTTVNYFSAHFTQLLIFLIVYRHI